MALFFEKYKKMRKDQKIDLSDIENRTKINVRFLEALENGEFDAIQQPYLRLFLRAYINEIGADPEIAISELTEFQLQKEGNRREIIPKKEIKPEKIEKKKSEKQESEKTPKNFGETDKEEKPANPIKKKQYAISPNLIKAILLIAAWILIIIFIRYITVETESEKNALAAGNNIDIISNYVDFEQLQSDFIEISAKETVLNVNPPFIVKIISRNVLGVVSQKDSLNIESIPLAAGAQSTIYYNSNLDLVLQHTNGVTVLINGEVLNDIKSQPNPVRLTFNSDPNILSIKHYSLIE